jgi:hypothetical protein
MLTHDLSLRLIHARLEPGRANAIGSDELARIAGIRQIQVPLFVRELRRNGVLVGSAHRGGYYLIQTEEELESTLDHILSRIQGHLQTERDLRSAWEASH